MKPIRCVLVFGIQAAVGCTVLAGTPPQADDQPAFSVVSVLFDDEALARPHDVELHNNLAFVPGLAGSLAIIDVSNPHTPQILWHRFDGRKRHGADTVLPSGDHLFVAAFSFDSIDLKDPRRPVFTKTVSVHPRYSRINGMVRRGDYVLAANKGGWIDVFDVSSPESPKPYGALNIRERDNFGSPHDIDSLGDHIIVVDPAEFGRTGSPGKVGLYRVADPVTHELRPVEEWRLEGLIENADLIGANRVQVSGNHAYVGGSQGGQLSNLVVVDVSNPSRPVQVAALEFSDPNGPNGLTVAGDVLFLAGGQTVEAIDISRPASPLKLASFQCLRVFPTGEDNAHDLVYRNGYLYVTGQNDNSFGILKVNDQKIVDLAEQKAP